MRVAFKFNGMQYNRYGKIEINTYNKCAGIQHESIEGSMILEIDSLLFFYLLLIDIILCHIRDKTLDRLYCSTV